MRKRPPIRKLTGILLPAIAAFVYLNNASFLADPIGPRPVLFPHRGLGQGFVKEGLPEKTCTAARMLPPEHEYLENTIRSMEVSFELGADVVEFDVQQTVDGQFAVFHDWTLDCRTEGTGETHEHTLEELQQLDIEFGYTSDGGETWPSCERSVITVPANVAPWLWGWPNRFLTRMDDSGSRVVMIGDYGGEGFSSGFDDPRRLKEIPGDYAGGIWTDRIDLIGPGVKRLNTGPERK